MTGDAETQPVEGALSLSDLADSMDEAPEAEEGADEQELAEAEEEEAESEQEEAEESTEEEQEEPTVTLKHDGKEVSLKQSEVVELAQKGFDYTQKTMALAEKSKAVESAQSQVEAAKQRSVEELNRTIERLDAFTQYMESQVGTPPPVEWAQENAAQYIALKQQYDDRKATLQQAFAAADSLRQEAQRKRQEQLAERAHAAEKALSDSLPGWNDALMGDLAKYLGTVGITPETAIDSFVTKGVWELAFKAKAYDALQAEKAKLKPKAELPKVQKPSGSQKPNPAEARRAEALKRHKAKPSFNSLTDLMD